MSLSKSQSLTLETVYLFLRTLRPFLVSLGNELPPASRENLDEINRLAQLNLERLCESFAEVADAHKRWNAQPGVVQSPKPDTPKQDTGLLQFVLERIEYIDSGELGMGAWSRRLAAETEIRDAFARAGGAR